MEFERLLSAAADYGFPMYNSNSIYKHYTK